MWIVVILYPMIGTLQLYNLSYMISNITEKIKR